jgi:hypothetical protein
MEATYSSETSVDFKVAARHYIGGCALWECNAVSRGTEDVVLIRVPRACAVSATSQDMILPVWSWFLALLVSFISPFLPIFLRLFCVFLPILPSFSFLYIFLFESSAFLTYFFPFTFLSALFLRLCLSFRSLPLSFRLIIIIIIIIIIICGVGLSP